MTPYVAAWNGIYVVSSIVLAQPDEVGSSEVFSSVVSNRNAIEFLVQGLTTLPFRRLSLSAL